MGTIIVIAVVLGIVRFAWWWKRQEGRNQFIACLDKRTARNEAMASLPEDMKFLKGKIAQLAEHTGLPEDEEADEEKAEGTDAAEEAA